MIPEYWVVNWFSGIVYWTIWIFISYYLGRGKLYTLEKKYDRLLKDYKRLKDDYEKLKKELNEE